MSSVTLRARRRKKRRIAAGVGDASQSLSGKRAKATTTAAAVELAAAAWAPKPQLQNFVCGFTVGGILRLNLKDMAMCSPFMFYNPVAFAAATIRLRKPQSAALVFASGSAVCTGTKSHAQALEAARRFIGIFQRYHGIECTFRDFGVRNVVASASCPYKIHINDLDLSQGYGNYCSYSPERFPGLTYRDSASYNSITFLVFVGGKVVITGAKNADELERAWHSFYCNVLTLFFDTDNQLAGMDSSDYREKIKRERAAESDARLRTNQRAPAPSFGVGHMEDNISLLRAASTHATPSERSAASELAKSEQDSEMAAILAFYGQDADESTAAPQTEQDVNDQLLQFYSAQELRNAAVPDRETLDFEEALLGAT
jgi:transcription initiation factor TFIID TATA-box-binding protein